MTPEDFAQIRAMLDVTEERINGKIDAAQSHTIEAMRDMQTEILRGIAAFGRGNLARMVRLEGSDAATTERLAAIEERLLALETRAMPPQ
jgi:hypothetical protein